jgi:hypothetical protein
MNKMELLLLQRRKVKIKTDDFLELQSTITEIKHSLDGIQKCDRIDENEDRSLKIIESDNRKKIN